MSQWVQLRIQAKAAQVDACENALLALGALSVTLQDNADQPILEPELGTTPLWDDTQLIGLFDADTHTAAIVEQFPLMFAAEGGVGSVDLPICVSHHNRMPSTCCLTLAWLLAPVRTRPPRCVCAIWMSI